MMENLMVWMATRLDELQQKDKEIARLTEERDKYRAFLLALCSAWNDWEDDGTMNAMMDSLAGFLKEVK